MNVDRFKVAVSELRLNGHFSEVVAHWRKEHDRVVDFMLDQRVIENHARAAYWIGYASALKELLLQLEVDNEGGALNVAGTEDVRRPGGA